METFLYNYFDFALSVIVIVAPIHIIAWMIFAKGRWKKQSKQFNPVLYWQNEALAARRQLRESDYKSRRENGELREALRKEKSKKR